MIDFPDNPTDGKIYTEEGSTWVYHDPPGGWSAMARDSPVREFHDPAGLKSWRIVGTTLECWGVTPGTASTETIVFPKTYLADPAVTVVGPSTGKGIANIHGLTSITPTQFQCKSFVADSGSTFAGKKIWRSIGKWDGVS